MVSFTAPIFCPDIFYWAIPAKIYPQAYFLSKKEAPDSVSAKLRYFSCDQFLPDTIARKKCQYYARALHTFSKDSASFFLANKVDINGWYFEWKNGSGILTPIIYVWFWEDRSTRIMKNFERKYGLCDSSGQAWPLNINYKLHNSHYYVGSFLQTYRINSWDAKEILEKTLLISKDTNVARIENKIDWYSGTKLWNPPYQFVDSVFETQMLNVNGFNYRLREGALWKTIKKLLIDLVREDTLEVLNESIYEYDGFEGDDHRLVAYYKIEKSKLFLYTYSSDYPCCHEDYKRTLNSYLDIFEFGNDGKIRKVKHVTGMWKNKMYNKRLHEQIKGRLDADLWKAGWNTLGVKTRR